MRGNFRSCSTLRCYTIAKIDTFIWIYNGPLIAVGVPFVERTTRASRCVYGLRGTMKSIVLRTLIVWCHFVICEISISARSCLDIVSVKSVQRRIDILTDICTIFWMYYLARRAMTAVDCCGIFQWNGRLRRINTDYSQKPLTCCNSVTRHHSSHKITTNKGNSQAI